MQIWMSNEEIDLIKSSSSLRESNAASLIAASSSWVLSLGFSWINVLNNQQPASEWRDSSRIDHSTIWPTPLSLLRILKLNTTANEENKLTPSVNAENISDSIKSNLMFLLVTDKGSRFYNRGYGTNLKKFLFEQNDFSYRSGR